ncbi:hypothetical protein E6Q11_03160 [Candidatus Dojkabacteria bacterium]|uniref:Uncharacterized protein n=1 Tax=Candidatus Dojkabacteria bacterium TaxID=2099670 RepID=A0A5C7J6T0_9BACT|nr:MAG: hypothetical protein E6Q11_03160 [Candidatus Dojkabacteria bacterium]
MANAYIDENGTRALIAASNIDGTTPVRLYADPVTHRLLVDLPGAAGTVTSFSFTDGNGFDGTVTNSTTTPTLSLTTTVADTRVMFSNNGAITGDAGMTYNSTTDTLTVTNITGATDITGAVITATTRVVTPVLRASATGGILIESDNGTDVALYGSLSGSGALYYGTVSVTGPILSATNDGSALGSASQAWSDLFLAEGGVINWDNGDATLTQSGNTLTVGGAELILDPAIGPTDVSSVGFRAVPQNSQSAAYTAVLSDAGKHILHPTADNNARTFTIPANASVAYPIGTAITFINQINTVTIAITTDTLVLAGSGATGSRTLAANGVATAIKIASTTWIISGTNLT